MDPDENPDRAIFPENLPVWTYIQTDDVIARAS